jgi:hypothetical protein
MLGLWLPWATIVLGGNIRRTAVDGLEIGSEVGLPVGWVVAGAGTIALFGLLRSKPVPVIAAGLVSLLATGYAVATIPDEDVFTEDFEIGPISGQAEYPIVQVEIAPGTFLLVFASIAVLVIGIRMTRGSASWRWIGGDVDDW